MSLFEDIAAYEPFSEQEEVDKQVILAYMRENPDCFERSSLAHMACSIWTVDPTFTQTLLVYHNIYDSWSWIGGHADGERDLAAVALRELAEETGVEHAQLVDCGIYSLEVLTVDGTSSAAPTWGRICTSTSPTLRWQTPPSRFASNRTRTAG